jgi:hypothetical protein
VVARLDIADCACFRIELHDLGVERSRLDDVGEMTAALTAAMSELAVSMHLIALNAQIQAIQHGRRTGLEVLAARMAEISRGISTVSHQALGALDDLSGRVRATITEFGRLCTDGEQHIRTREVEWRDRAADLRSLRDSSARAMAALGEKSAAVATVSRRIVEGFRVRWSGTVPGADTNLGPDVIVTLATVAVVERSSSPAALSQRVVHL